MNASPRLAGRLAGLALTLLVLAQAPAAEPLGGDFTLRTAGGEVSLADLRGKVVPIYFGFMSCPDVCPTTLSVLGAALRELHAGEIERVQAVFVSLDPERDDPSRLAEFARFFHPSIIGATGSQEVLRDVTRRYRVAYARVTDPDSAGYTLEHTSRLVLVGPDGSMRRLIADGTPPEVVTDAIRQLLGRS